jgi:hypothetical protein
MPKCPRCGTQLSASRRKPRRTDDERDPFNQPTDDGLSAGAVIGYLLLFLPIPAVNVIVSSVLHYSWRTAYPKCAKQINTLGFIVFGIHIVVLAILIAEGHI